MTVPTLLAILVVAVAMPLNWYFAVSVLRYLRTSPDLWPLKAQAVSAMTTALVVTVFAVVFVNNEQEVPWWDVDTTRLLTRGGLLALSIPGAVYWLRRSRRVRT